MLKPRYLKDGGNQRYPPAVVLPSDRPAALGLARSLGKHGISVYGIDSDPHALAMGSKYLKACPLPAGDESDENKIQYLLSLGRELGEAVLFPVSDDTVILCSQYREELQRYFHFVLPDHRTINSVLTKDGLHKIATLHDIPAPRLFPACSQSEVVQIADQLPYPVILKPVFSPSWLHEGIIALLRDNFLSGPSKVAYCGNAEILVETYKRIAVYDPHMIIEEVIPGEDERLVYYCFYLDRDSKPLAGFAGRKLRVLPVGFGSATFVQSIYDPQLEDISRSLLTSIKYQGLGGIEFKKDPRDEQYKMIEFNARLGMWDSLSIRCGIDIPYIAYMDALGEKVEPQTQYRENVFWIDFQRDVRAFLILNRRKQLGLKAWLKSYSGEKEWAVFSWDDWKPELMATGKLVEVSAKRLISMVPFFRKKNQG